MGKEIHGGVYSKEDVDNFRQRLTEETQCLEEWFRNKSFIKGLNKTGVELEAWLVDENMLPDPYSTEFLANLNHPQVVPEIAKFNFEINSSPYELKNQVFTNLSRELKTIWKTCSHVANKDNKVALLVGTLPSLRPHMLSTEYLSPQNRYSIMNDRVMQMRDRRPLYIRLEGKDDLYMYMDSVIAECAATSLQIHLSVNQDNAKRYYNASLLASPFLIALSANAPYFFGKELWDESRIAIFEQAVDLDAKSPKGHNVKRVTLGNGYVKKSLFELFDENLNDYPILLPEKIKGEVQQLNHLNLHNGTIWRWTRPIVGLTEDGRPHLRIEQRTPSAGPTVEDSIANTAFFIGLVDYFAQMQTSPEDCISFDEAIHNFYKASRQSYFCRVRWIDGKLHDIKDLMQYEIYPYVKQALLKRGIDKAEIDYYLDGIILERLKKGINGAIWQKAFIHMHGKRFQELIEAYIKNQSRGFPVHKWELK
ncbi:MAG: glutamate-cysteine ligase family protein [Bacteriovoracaceae bacterium]|jgi:hypothetical protein|nr:hypothetical protein [Halobacteriovoraceae bacterium]MDP7322090.1 glutamate-cysteine ligase family protein [Bacteriovoracaceae bacterium]